jgi:hypothetical protein
MHLFKRLVKRVATPREVAMPDDWNDHAGWETYHRSLLAMPERGIWANDTGSIRADQLPHLAAELKAKGWRSVWVPGCGLSPLAYLLAHLGIEVTATDVSPAAINFQRDAPAKLIDLTKQIGPAILGGALTAEVHDFRTPYRQEVFDLIINVKAIQAFVTDEMAAIARVHAEALRPGRYAYFDTMNVQGNRRDELEQALEDGGFVVPLLALNRWYRRALAETGIPHLFILGQPVIPRTDEYARGDRKWKADMARLQKISTEYQSRLASEQEAEQSRIGADAKVAHIIYSTG